MDKRFLAIVAILIIGFIGFVIFNKSDDAKAPSAPTVSATNHTRGTGSLTLVEYGDFQCPACAAYKSTVDAVVEKYKDQITFQFRHFPLTQMHPNAFAGARAAEAASKQGKFWEMYDTLYTNQTTWSSSNRPNDSFNNYAKNIGLNIDTFKSDFKSSAVNDAINADRKAGEKDGITGTPTFILDGKKLDSPAPSVDVFSKLIDEALAKKKDS